MSAFGTGDMADALNDVSNVSNTDPGAVTVPIKNEEAHQAARDKGWVAPQAYDYKTATQPFTANQEETNGPTWAHNASKYEWKEEFGDVGPPVPELEKELFHSELQNRKGIKFDNLCSIKVIAEAEDKPNPIHDFKSAGLHPVITETIELCGYDFPTPVQAYTIPTVMKGFDILAVAQTGSGKTAAFLIPTISKLMGKVKKLAAPRPNIANGFDAQRDRVRAEPLILIVAPTRELCCQIFDEARRLCYRSMIRPCVAYGGGPLREQVSELQKGCDLLVATPGRLIDIMARPHVLSLARLRFTVIDEADEMLHADWEEDMAKIMSGGDTNEDGNHQYLLFSATFDKNMRKLAKNYLANNYVRIRIGRAGSVHGNVKQHVIYVERNLKQQALYDLLLSMPPSRTLVFVNSKKTADFVDDFLFNMGLPSTSIHADRTQREREDALRSFRTGRCPILVATGVSARGLDIRNVMHVINYDLPTFDQKGQDEYVHRIGRTARIGNEGLATSFYNDKDEPMGEFLAKILMESGQDVPPFLEGYKPEGGTIDFHDDSGVESNDDISNGGDGIDTWGTSTVEASAQDKDDGWGKGDTKETDNGNAADEPGDNWGISATTAQSSAW